jgi:hypothetical protein
MPGKGSRLAKPKSKIATPKGSGGLARKAGAPVKKVAPKASPVSKPLTPAQDPWSTGKIGEFINSAVGQMTGKIPSPISGAMKNKTPVIPYTEKNIKAIKKARP